jgi:hypothetical protein
MFTGYGADDSVQALIREEREIARWLDRQISQLFPIGFAAAYLG